MNSRQALRLEALQHISGNASPSCKCCGETRLWALTFDHVHNGGTQERQAAGNANTLQLIRRHLKETGVYPIEKYQVLCATCNHGRRVGDEGKCPHSLEYMKLTKINWQKVKAFLGTIVRVFVGACVAAFASGGVDVFAFNEAGLKTVLSAGIGATALAVFNYVNPNDTRYGVGS